jgi:integrase
MSSPDTVQGFLDRIDQSGQCWAWPGSWRVNGYPLVKFQGRQWPVHRLAYTLLVGPLEPRQMLRKCCAQPGCVRPGPGHWVRCQPEAVRVAKSLPRGIRYEGCDKRGVDVWRVSVYLGRDERGKPIEQRLRVHGSVDAALQRRDELLARREEERGKLNAGVYGKSMAELLDRYFPVWQKTPRKGHLPAKITVYHRHQLIEKVIKPALGQRIPAEVLPGQIADWYDELMEYGYTTIQVIQERLAAGRCQQCGKQVEAVAKGRRRTASTPCPTPGCNGQVVCRSTGQHRPRTRYKQHPPVSPSTLGDIHAVLRGAFRFGVQRGWVAMDRNPMIFVERRSGQHARTRPPSPEQVRGALQAAGGHKDPNLEPFLALAADTGARLSELCALRLSDFSMEACAVRLEEAVSELPKAFGGRHLKDTKTHNKRVIAIHPQTMRRVLAHLDHCRRLARTAEVAFPEDPFIFPAFVGRRWVIAPDKPTSFGKMGRSVSQLFASLGIEATAKSLRAFVVTNWRQARVPDDVLRGRIGHEAGTPVTDRHYNYQEGVRDRRETDLLVSELLYGPEDGDDNPSPASGVVISLDDVRARRLG